MSHHIMSLNTRSFSFNDMVNSNCYLAIFHNNNIMLQITTTLLQVPISNQWLIQNGARLYTANVVLDFLYGNLGPQVISH
jgi:hypothetical protein